MNKGAFLKEKLQNMCAWVTNEIGKENLPIDIVFTSSVAQPVLVTALALEFQSHGTKVTHRDWQGLVQVMTDAGYVEMVAIIQAVRSKPDMHDRFWRYLELFRDITNSNSEAVKHAE